MRLVPIVAAALLLEAPGASAVDTGLVGDAPFTFAAAGVPLKANAAIDLCTRPA